ncbi:hypothetical protein F441_11401 [Phytophthora nicotianae CJ01A1]|uniref:Uncharacterized protein n=2 Tax=Phytophthora nicotianae TaxID=4792 RepID=W2WV44_PHYNI|nr:hypothetical protein L915_11178 [Phytophthora nicotianae]ETP13454.1 hypothetical protein F441_11401 [Phytophthora nicotianae CJ01A1]
MRTDSSNKYRTNSIWNRPGDFRPLWHCDAVFRKVRGTATEQKQGLASIHVPREIPFYRLLAAAELGCTSSLLAHNQHAFLGLHCAHETHGCYLQPNMNGNVSSSLFSEA